MTLHRSEGGAPAGTDYVIPACVRVCGGRGGKGGPGGSRALHSSTERWTPSEPSIAGWSGGDDTLLDRPQRPSVVNGTTDLTVDGYAINYGNSTILAVDFADGAPRARGILTYSQSQDEDSPHFADQTQLHATQTLREVRFTEEEIAANVIESVHLSHPGPASE